MATGFFWLFILLALIGAPTAAGYALAASLLCALGWLLFGPGKHWL